MSIDNSTQHAISPDSLAALPRSPGVYIFRGDGTLPLYIGKSVDIRSRVLSHLRTPDEAHMVAQTKRIDFIETAGESGALLLEAQMIKMHSPLFNIRLRRLKNLNSIRLQQTTQGLSPEIVNNKDLAFGQVDGIFGLFSSQRAAQEKLRELAKEHMLCHALLGLEKLSKRGCFGRQIKTCHGACVGQENRSTHDQRLFSALLDMKVHAWPYKGAIDLIEGDGEWTQKHRVHHWRYLGTWCSKEQSFNGVVQNAFDVDTYKILVKPVMLGTGLIEEV
jgi:excinuclease Cho